VENSGSLAPQIVEIDVLMGHSPAKVDDKGRIKIPSNFRRVIEQRWGADCFMTSIEGEKAVIYPLAVWQETLSRMSRVPSASRAKAKFLERANYYGQVGSIDAQGRLLVPGVLRAEAGINEDVVVLGNADHLIVWNEERMQKRLSDSPMTDEDYKELELHGV
jgi:MraZ protein